MTDTIGFRPTEEDKRIIEAAMEAGEHKSDVLRRGLRLLEKEVWLAKARADLDRIRDEDLSDEPDAW